MKDFYTFGLEWPDGMFEEVDVRAHTYAEARANAFLVADRDYKPGFKLVDMDPGGSGGLVMW